MDAHVEALNHALRDIPTERIRHHTCYGLNHGPRMNDIPLIEVVPYMLAINVRAPQLRGGESPPLPRVAHLGGREAPRGQDPDPLIGLATNYVEHPELVADYIVKYAGLVGRENVIAGSDCGFSSHATYSPEVHPTVVWPKFRALAEGAALAAKELWG